MDTNDLQQSLLDTIDLLSTKIANSTNAPLTIKAEIVEELDSGLHQYSIKYGGTTYKDAYSTANMSYEPSTVVYILIPDGNFDNPKLILNAVEPTTYVYADETETVSHVPASDNIISDSDKTALDLDLQSWEDKEYPHVVISESNTLLNDYFKTYRNFVFSAKVKTEIDKDHQVNGNYGLKLRLPFKQANTSEDSQVEEIYKEFVMDVTTMQGNPYAFNEYQTVNLYYELDDTLTFDPDRDSEIIPFTKDFNYATTPTIESDIHIRNVSIQVIDVLTEENQTGYHLSIVSDSGQYFMSGRYVTNKILSPLLKVNGKTTKNTGYDCYWFVKDSSIDETSDRYLGMAGPGWRCLNEKTNVGYDDNGKETYQYVLNNFDLTVAPAEVISTAIYRCMLVKNTTITSAEIKLKNLDNNLVTSLVSYTGSNTYVENVGNVTLIASINHPKLDGMNYSIEWQRYDKDNNYLGNDFFEYQAIEEWNEEKQTYQTIITFPSSLIEKLNTINCTFYRSYEKDNKIVNENIATESIVIKTSSDITFTVTIEGGDKLYKYDSNGNSPMEGAYDGPVSSRVQATDPLTFRVFKPDGSELTETEYKYCNFVWSFPVNSMMRLPSSIQREVSPDGEYYYIEGKGKHYLNYTLLSTYNKKKSNNNVLLSITLNGDTVLASTSIKFVKDGEGGTNGSKYSAYITYQFADGSYYGYGQRDEQNRLMKFQGIYVPSNIWKRYDVTRGVTDFGTPHFSVKVFRDGEEITSGFTVTWKMFDQDSTSSAAIPTTTPCFNISSGNLSIKSGVNWETESSIFCNIIEAKIQITDGSVTNASESVYAYYPIEITRVMNTSMLDKVVPNLDGGFDEVTYASDGTNPQYDSSNPFSCVDAVYQNNVDLLYTWSWSSNFTGKVNTDNTAQVTIKPSTKYDSGITQNYVKAILTINQTKINEINKEIATLNIQKTSYNTAIATYNTLISYARTLLSFVAYNTYKTKLDGSSKLLQYRYNLLNTGKLLKEKLEELYKYTSMSGIYFNYEEFKNILNTQYNKVYLLDYSSTFDELTSLEDLRLSERYSNYTEDSGSTSSSISPVSPINKSKNYNNKYNPYVREWNNLITKYDNTLSQLKSYSAKDTELSNLKSLSSALLGLKNQNYITGLGLQTQISAIVNQITNDSSDITSLTAYDGLLKQIDKIVNTYKVGYRKVNNIIYSNYIDIYLNKITELQKNVSNVDNKIAELNSYIINQTNKIIHIKPIVMHYNRYEFSGINGWDGSKLYIDPTNEQYLYAPQIGAGIKNSGNTFTGIVMGIKQATGSFGSYKNIGLFGISEGVQSLFLNAQDGSAIFGKSGAGQMIIDPTPTQSKALLYSSNYWKTYDNSKGGKPSNYTDSNKTNAGMLINLTESCIHLGSAADGRIYSGLHNSLDNDADGFYLNQSGLSIGSKVWINANGVMKLGLKATKGGTKCWTINASSDANNSYIAYGSQGRDDSVYLGTDKITLGSKFYVDSNGVMKVGQGATGTSFRHWTIDGTGTTSENSYSYISFNTTNLYFDFNADNPTSGASSNQVYLGTNGIRLGTKFAVDKDGNFYASNGKFKGNIEATSGTIGGWEIKSDRLIGWKTAWTGEEYQAVIIRSDGEIYANKEPETVSIGDPWHLYSDGRFICDMSNSYFGGVSITDNGTSYDSSLSDPFKGTCRQWILDQIPAPPDLSPYALKSEIPSQINITRDDNNGKIRIRESNGQGGWNEGWGNISLA